MERDGQVERCCLRDAFSWDARRAAHRGTEGRSPRRVLGTPYRAKSSPPEAGERTPTHARPRYAQQPKPPLEGRWRAQRDGEVL